jgi:flagellar biogenesis protein FliO
MKKQTLFTLLYIFLIVGLVLFMIWIVFWLQGAGKECLAQPIEYYQRQSGAICNCFMKQGFGE